jgi:DNA replication and repair protein RecF
MGELRNAELASGVSLVGPHRHEIRFLFHGNDSRFFCSQGQQRALIIALKLAQIMYHKQSFGNYPILVLDDVLSELDEGKRANLIGYLMKIETQVFVTTTDLSKAGDFQKQEGLILKVQAGAIGQF